VGVLGFPLIGLLQENAVRDKVNPAVYQQVSTVKEGVFGTYQAVDPDKVKLLSPEESKEVTTSADKGKKEALATMAIFPCIMLVCYLILIAYFRAKGGYQAEVLAGHAADDSKFTGGVEGPVE